MRSTVIIFSSLLMIGYPHASFPLGIYEGMWSIGGTGNYTEIRQKTGKVYMSGRVYGTASYFVTDNISVGGTVGYTSFGNSDWYMWSKGVGPTARYYFSSGQIAPYVSLLYSYNESDSVGGQTTYTEIVSSGVGVDLFLTEFVALEISVRYDNQRSYRSTSGEDDDKNYIRGSLNLGFNLFF